MPASQVSWAETICGIFAHRPNCRWPNCRFLLKFHHQSFDTECRAWITSRRSHIGSAHPQIYGLADWPFCLLHRVSIPVLVASVARGPGDREGWVAAREFSMRHAWFLALCRRRLLGVILAGELAFTGVGCHQHYYYYGDSCPPGAPTCRALCGQERSDVPTEVVEGGTKLADGSSRSTIVSGAVSNNSPRVVVSEPIEPAAPLEDRMETIGS